MSSAITIGGFTAPDTAIIRSANVLVERSYSKAMMNHVHRTWWFAEFLGNKRGLKFDREQVYLGSLLHDLGLTKEFAADKRFEVDGADAASKFLREQGFPESKTQTVWDAIALHSSAEIAERKVPEIALVFLGAHVDVMGLNIQEISPALIEDTLALYPRLGFKKAFTEALAEVARRKPHTAIGTGLADIGRRLIDGLEIPNVCDIIHAAPFES
jgi:hypothetical protein